MQQQMAMIVISNVTPVTIIATVTVNETETEEHNSNNHSPNRKLTHSKCPHKWQHMHNHKYLTCPPIPTANANEYITSYAPPNAIPDTSTYAVQHPRQRATIRILVTISHETTTNTTT
eukprot:980812-Ditylum_brightwellii.AAC.1